MNKSKGIFFILGLAYTVIALGSLISLFEIKGSILLGLSITSFLISVGDTISSFFSWRMMKNDYNYTLQVAIDFLSDYIDTKKQPVTQIDVYNVRKSIEDLKTMNNAISAIDYRKKKRIIVSSFISKLLFFLAFSCFVVMPFIKQEFDASIISQIFTLLAFASMCINIGLSDQQADVFESRQYFENDKQLIIEGAFPGYLNAFIMRVQHKEVYQETQKQKTEQATSNSNYGKNNSSENEEIKNPILAPERIKNKD